MTGELHTIIPSKNVDIMSESVSADIAYAPLGTSISESVAKTLRAALNHYNDMLAQFHAASPESFPYASLDTVPDQSLLHCIGTFSRFGNYLRLNKKLAFHSALSYASSIRNHIKRLNKDSDICCDEFFKHFRVELKKKYVEQCVCDQTPISTTSDPFSARHVHVITNLLFTRNTNVDITNRLIIVLQWQLLGRISELTALTDGSFRYYSNLGGIQVTMVRLKVNMIHDIICFPHYDDFVCCPLHALACHYAVNQTNGPLLPLLKKDDAAQKVNSMLRAVQAQYRSEGGNAEDISLDIDAMFDRNYTSKSGRSGGSTAANEHGEVLTQDIIPRGGWDLKGIQTVFNYIFGTSKMDSKVARVLSGWPHTDAGGRAPTSACLSPPEQKEFDLFAYRVLGPAALQPAVRYLLAAALVHRYVAVLEKYPTHLIVQLMQNAGVEHATLVHWSRIFTNEFQRLNSSALLSPPLITPTPLQTPITHSLTTSTAPSLPHAESQLQHLQDQLHQLYDGQKSIMRILQGKRKILSDSAGSAGSAGSGGSGSDSSGGNTLAPRSGTTSKRIVQQTITTFTIRPNTLPPTPLQSIPPNMLRLRGVQANMLFLSWYDMEVHKATIEGSGAERKRKAATFARMASMIRLLHRFLPADTIIEPRPSYTAADFSAYTRWRARIQRLSDIVQRGAEDFCTTHRELIKATKVGVVARNRRSTGMTEGLYRRLTMLKSKTRLPAVAVGVEDRAWPGSTIESSSVSVSESDSDDESEEDIV